MFRKKRRRGPEAGSYLEHLERLTTDAGWSHGYETIVANLAARSESKLASLLITSTQPAEGKTTVATNLGIALAMAGKRVVLVDADFRRPSFETIFSGAETSNNGSGLADLLDGRRDENEIIRNVVLPAAGARREVSMSVVATGHVGRRRFAALDSRRFDDAIRAWTREADIVLVDSPPVLAVSDALLVAPKVDGVLFVVQAGSVSERELKRAKASVEEAGGKLVGVVMNRFDDASAPAYHPYSRYYENEA